MTDSEWLLSELDRDLPTALEPVARLAVEADVRRGPVKHGRIYVRVKCLVQANGDGTVTVSVPRLSYDTWTGATEAEARMLALRALDDPWVA